MSAMFLFVYFDFKMKGTLKQKFIPIYFNIQNQENLEGIFSVHLKSDTSSRSRGKGTHFDTSNCVVLSVDFSTVASGPTFIHYFIMSVIIYPEDGGDNVTYSATVYP